MSEENKEFETREDALDELTKIAQETGEYDLPASSSSATPPAKEAKKPAKKPTKKPKKPAKAKVEKKETPTKPEVTFFGKHETPDAKWFEGQKKNDTTRELEVAEYFYLLSTATTKDEKIALLRKAKGDPVIMTLLNMNYSPALYVPHQPNEETLGSYRPNKLPWGLNPYTIRKQSRMLKYLFANSAEGKNVPQQKKEYIVRELLESLHPTESRILAQCLTQSLDIEGLDGKLVKAAFGASRFPYIK